MKKFFRNNGIFLIIIAVLLAAVLGVGASVLGYNPIAGLLNAVGTPFRAVSTAISNWTQDQYDRTFRYEQMEIELEQLRREIAELEKSAQESQDAIREVERLKDLLNLANERPEFSYADSAVTQRSSTNWGSNLTINKGTAQGVEVNDTVIDQYGNLVGVVTETGPNWALVTTILDPQIELGARIARIDESMILEGDFTLMKEGMLRMTFIPTNTLLISGDKVVTSGLGELYPAGLSVGTIRSLHTEADGTTRYAIVEPAADLESVRYVFVITDF